MSYLFAKDHPWRQSFRQLRQRIIRLWRWDLLVPKLMRFNAYTGYIGRRLFQYVPFILPHDKSYYGFSHLVKPGDGLFLDIGANDGISAIGFHHIHNDYRILSIEPNRAHEASLRRLCRKLKGFEYRICGAGECKDKRVLYMPYYQGVPIFTAASFDLSFVQSSMHIQFDSKNIQNVSYIEQLVDILPLDELHLQPSIIKIDTEGYDLHVLKGLRQTIEKHRPFIMLEYNPTIDQEERAWLGQMKYAFFRYDFKGNCFEMYQPEEQNKVRVITGIFENMFCIPCEKITALPIRKTHD